MHTYFELDVNHMALFEPGKGYHYTDTGYVLLGYCIQELTGKPLAQNFRQRIIEPLKLSNTYLEFYEKPEEKREQAHAFMGSLDVTAFINTSFDWAGGGLVSTTKDLTTFIKALFELKLFRDPELLQAMMAKEGYGLGMGTYAFGDKLWYGHTGFWGSALFYQPEDQLTICITFNQVAPPFDTTQVIRKLAEEMR
ncbi:serine hydrolase domain-containing protein [Robertkochia flava]|uniref:serine hydrolase domain-containing protein n=1 Tax=Robertkochia flava TaxID=3447986 RepID=UPI001CCFABA4|nr:serine hydrolase domain-containing protein [Robertkochia marina]